MIECVPMKWTIVGLALFGIFAGWSCAEGASQNETPQTEVIVLSEGDAEERAEIFVEKHGMFIGPGYLEGHYDYGGRMCDAISGDMSFQDTWTVGCWEMLRRPYCEDWCLDRVAFIVVVDKYTGEVIAIDPDFHNAFD